MKYIDVFSPKETFRAARLEGLVPDVGRWLKYSEGRNITIYAYSEDILETVYFFLPQFWKILKYLSKISRKLKMLKVSDTISGKTSENCSWNLEKISL